MNTIRSFTILLTIIHAGCSLDADPTEQNQSDLTSQVKQNGISFTLSLSTSTFSLFDTLQGTFRVLNEGETAREFRFSNIQQLGFHLKDAEGNVSLFYPFIVSPALSAFSLQPQEAKEFVISWPFKNHDGQYIQRGNYQLSAFLLDRNSPEVTLKIRIE